jgi:hypothetical protein
MVILATQRVERHPAATAKRFGPPPREGRRIDMKFRTTKNPVFCPMGLRRAMPTALAVVATLALVSSAQAQTTYTWDGGGANDNWTTGNNWDTDTVPVSSLTSTDLVFAGSTRPYIKFNLADFSANNIEFNTTAAFTIDSQNFGSGYLRIGAGGIVNNVAYEQTFITYNDFSTVGSGTTPLHVASGGGISLDFWSVGDRVLEKTGGGTLNVVGGNFDGLGTGYLQIQAGTVNGSAYTGITFDLEGGTLNTPDDPGSTEGSWYSYDNRANVQSGGVHNFDGHMNWNPYVMTGGVLNIGYNFVPAYVNMAAGATFGPGTAVNVNDDPNVDARFYNQLTAGPAVTISGGNHHFAQAWFDDHSPLQDSSSVLITGGTSTGFVRTQGLSNNGGTINFEPYSLGASENEKHDLLLTSGTVSIKYGDYGRVVNSQNTTLGAGNTLKLDLNEDLTRDLLITSGTLNWGGNVALNLTNLGEVANGSEWDFFSDPVFGNTNAFAGHLDGITLAATDTYNGLTFSKSGSLWTSTATVGGQQFTFEETTGVLAVVPEPSSIAVVGMGLAMLGWRRLAGRQRAAA